MRADVKVVRPRWSVLEQAEQLGASRPAGGAACAEMPSASTSGASRLPALKAIRTCPDAEFHAMTTPDDVVSRSYKMRLSSPGLASALKSAAVGGHFSTLARHPKHPDQNPPQGHVRNGGVSPEGSLPGLKSTALSDHAKIAEAWAEGRSTLQPKSRTCQRSRLVGTSKRG